MRYLRFVLILAGISLLLGTLSACQGAGQGVTEDTSDTKDTAVSQDTATTAEEVTETTETTAPDEDYVYQVTDRAGEDGLDFIIDFPAGKDITILQITDTQMQTMAGVRNENRHIQVGNAFFSVLPDDFEFRVWRYMDEAVAKSSPDLIVLTGDNIYGELDDSGQMWLSLIQKMDSYGIPWCVVFGNHDNESGKGVQWQVEQLLSSQYCIFRQGDVAGNSNYNLLIRQGGEAKYLLYMLDSNGCQTRPGNPGEGMMPDNVDIDKIDPAAGFRRNQISWLTNSSEDVQDVYGQVPVLMFFHIPPIEAVQYTNNTYGAATSHFPFVPTLEGDLGMSREVYGGASSTRFWKTAQDMGCVGMFVGHQHEIATSIMCDGIRVTYGLKTSTYDYHAEDMLGSTKITIFQDSNEFAVTYLPTELTYQP